MGHGNGLEFNETKGETMGGRNSCHSQGENPPYKREEPRLAQPLEYFNGDIHKCCPRLENETEEVWTERAIIVAREYAGVCRHDFGVPNKKKKEEVMAPDCSGSDVPGGLWPKCSGPDLTKFNEGDVNSKERGTCARSNAGKVDFSLVPFHLLAGAARVLEQGAKEYAPWNWAKGGKWSTPFNCLLRHLFKWWFCGENIDKKSGKHHLDHVMCNLLFLMHYIETFSDGDDRPEKSMTGFDQSLHLLEPHNEDH